MLKYAACGNAHLVAHNFALAITDARKLNVNKAHSIYLAIYLGSLV